MSIMISSDKNTLDFSNKNKIKNKKNRRQISSKKPKGRTENERRKKRKSLCKASLIFSDS